MHFCRSEIKVGGILGETDIVNCNRFVAELLSFVLMFCKHVIFVTEVDLNTLQTTVGPHQEETYDSIQMVHK